MSFLINLFGKKKSKTIHLDGLGDFSYSNDGTDEYWSIEQPVGKLPSNFDFGAISGNLEGQNSEALEAFKFYAEKPEWRVRHPCLSFIGMKLGISHCVINVFPLRLATGNLKP